MSNPKGSLRRLDYEQLVAMTSEEVADFARTGLLPAHVPYNAHQRRALLEQGLRDARFDDRRASRAS